jgi:hypothetical protein
MVLGSTATTTAFIDVTVTNKLYVEAESFGKSGDGLKITVHSGGVARLGTVPQRADSTVTVGGKRTIGENTTIDLTNGSLVLKKDVIGSKGRALIERAKSAAIFKFGNGVNAAPNTTRLNGALIGKVVVGDDVTGKSTNSSGEGDLQQIIGADSDNTITGAETGNDAVIDKNVKMTV